MFFFFFLHTTLLNKIKVVDRRVAIYFPFGNHTPILKAAISAFTFDNLPLVVCAESTLWPSSLEVSIWGANSLSGEHSAWPTPRKKKGGGGYLFYTYFLPA